MAPDGATSVAAVTAFVTAVATATILIGITLTVVGARRHEVIPGRPTQVTTARASRHAVVLVLCCAAGMAMWWLTGFIVAVIAVPTAALLLPALLRTPASGTPIAVLSGLEQWTRGLSGMLVVGAGIETALAASVGSAPPAVRPAVQSLSTRLNARWPISEALRAFADDLDDATADLIAATLLLGAQRRGEGLAAVLDDLAVTVADEVRIRREVEADRARPRTTARIVTGITLAVLAVLTVSGYLGPYGSLLGQLLLTGLLTAFVGCLVWLRRATAGRATPRFLVTSARAPG